MRAHGCVQIGQSMDTRVDRPVNFLGEAMAGLGEANLKACVRLFPFRSAMAPEKRSVQN
jgi:hypothetical protein